MTRTLLILKILPVFLLLSLMAWAPGIIGPVRADIFRYQDENGVVHFTNVPSDSRYRLFYREFKANNQGAPYKLIRKAQFSRTTNFRTPMPLLVGHIDEVSSFYGVDPKLIQAVIQVESNFDPQAISPKGAQGLMQLMPQTARDLQVFDPFSPRDNIVGGARYLRYLLDLYRQDMSLALAAYNAGPEKVNLHNGIPPYPETRNYVQKVLQVYYRLKNKLVSTR